MSPAMSPAPAPSPRQTTNHANAQHSTGPRTPAGKAATRLNAMTHGLTARIENLPPEIRAELEAYAAPLLAELAPVGPLETSIARSVAEGRWRLERVRVAENQLFLTADSDAEAFVQHGVHISRLSLYESRISNTINREMKELRKLQATRRVATDAALVEAVADYQQAKATGRLYTPAPGSVFSADHLEALLDRQRRLKLARQTLGLPPAPRNRHQNLLRKAA